MAANSHQLANNFSYEYVCLSLQHTYKNEHNFYVLANTTKEMFHKYIRTYINGYVFKRHAIYIKVWSCNVNVKLLMYITAAVALSGFFVPFQAFHKQCVVYFVCMVTSFL